MKLRPPFSIQQLLFTAGCAFLLGTAAPAQDTVITTDNQQRYPVKVLGVSPSGQLEFQVGQGKQIVHVDRAVAGVDFCRADFQTGDDEIPHGSK